MPRYALLASPLFAATVATLGLLVATASVAGQLSIGAGSSLDLGSGSLDLGCADLSVGGTLAGGSVGFAQARDVLILSGGLVVGSSATLELAGAWSNAGTFQAESSTVQMVDGCGLSSALISGDTIFNNLQMSTSSGFLYRFVSGSIQTVMGSLALLGAPANHLTIRSSVGGSEAFLNVQGTSSADFVDVQDNDASPGNHIALGPNSFLGPNTKGWLSTALVPALSLLGLSLLGLALGWCGRWALAARQRVTRSPLRPVEEP